MTLTLRTRKALATTASLAAAVAVLGACTGHHATAAPQPAGSSSSPGLTTVPLPLPITPSSTSTSTRPVSTSPTTVTPAPTTVVPIVNPVTPQPKPPSADLPAGQTGSRDQVPWGNLGPGWRLVQPTGSAVAPVLYLYDPEGGRYLISSSLPHNYVVAGWSADGSTAALQAIGSWSGVQLLDVHRNALGARIAHADFVTFTRPQGQALLVSVKYNGLLNVQRFGRDGGHQLTYGNSVPGQDFAAAEGAIYLTDGTAFLVHSGNRAALISNGDRLLQQYAIPAGYRTCRPVKLWTPGTFLEACISNDDLRTGLFAQNISSGSRQTVAADGTRDYFSAWLLSNGDVLVWGDLGHCADDPYLIKHPNGSTVRLRMPSGLQQYAGITDVSGDIATFGRVPGSACPVARTEQQTSYNILTGETHALPLIGHATFVNLGTN